MDTACPVQERRDEKSGKKNGEFFSGQHIRHHPVNSYRPDQRKKRVEDYIDVIVPETEDIENGKDFDEYISFQVVPVRVGGFKEFGNAAFIRVIKKIGKIFMWILE